MHNQKLSIGRYSHLIIWFWASIFKVWWFYQLYLGLHTNIYLPQSCISRNTCFKYVYNQTYKPRLAWVGSSYKSMSLNLNLKNTVHCVTSASYHNMHITQCIHLLDLPKRPNKHIISACTLWLLVAPNDHVFTAIL